MEVAAQHSLVLVRMKMREERKGKEKRARRIKWWKLREPEVRKQFKGKVLENWVKAERVQGWWTTNIEVLRGSRRSTWENIWQKAPTDKETWWWNEEIQSIVRRKKTLNKVRDTSGKEEDRRRY